LLLSSPAATHPCTIGPHLQICRCPLSLSCSAVIRREGIKERRPAGQREEIQTEKEEEIEGMGLKKKPTKRKEERKLRAGEKAKPVKREEKVKSGY
jgi:hypothetical protein